MDVQQREQRMDKLIELGLDENEAYLMTAPLRQVLEEGNINAAQNAWDKRNTLVAKKNKEWMEKNPKREGVFSAPSLHGTTSKVR
jgi:hypothetical protein